MSLLDDLHALYDPDEWRYDGDYYGCNSCRATLDEGQQIEDLVHDPDCRHGAYLRVKAALEAAEAGTMEGA